MMSELALFLFGCLVTALCLAGVALLLWGARLDGAAQAEAERSAAALSD
jgi:hypothetical protein